MPKPLVVISTAQGRERRNAAVSRSEQSLLCVQLDVTRYVDFDSENEDDWNSEGEWTRRGIKARKKRDKKAGDLLAGIFTNWIKFRF